MKKADYNRVLPKEIERWYEQAFVEGLSIQKIADQSGRQWITVKRHLGKPEALAREKEIKTTIAKEARDKLHRATIRAADSWIKQLELADQGQRANHLPAKDLLTHTGVVDVAVPNQDKGTQILIQIGLDKSKVRDVEIDDVVNVTPQ